MAIKYVDPHNVINLSAPDSLRAELGKYWEINEDGNLSSTDKFKSNKLDDNKTIITSPIINDVVLFPEKTQTISIVGRDSEFRDHTQWREFINKKINNNRYFFDHYFIINNNYNLEKILNKNIHNPEYEDATKIYDSNLLLNINLMNYKNNAEAGRFIRNSSGILTKFDSTDTDGKIPNSSNDFKRLYNEYTARIENYTGSLSQLNVKQRNIFLIEQGRHLGVESLGEVLPYVLQINYNSILPMPTLDFLNETRQLKYLFQGIKRNVAFQNSRFYANSDQVNVRAHNMINLILNYDAANFLEERDETFLLEEEDINPNSISNRFINQIRKIRMLEKLQTQIFNNLRDYEETINGIRNNTQNDVTDIGERHADCREYVLGYKIEKYLDNDATLPIQTYYTTSLTNFLDTQLKFGRKYIYKAICLKIVLGSLYSYSDLFVSNESGEMESSTNEVLEDQISTTLDKYKAQLKVTIKPSLQIIEIPLQNFEKMFFDEPPPTPEVIFYNERGKRNSLKIYLQANLNEMYDKHIEFTGILDSDDEISNNLLVSSDSVYGTTFVNKYAIGAFEIYRMDSKPKFISDFRGNYLTTVDQKNNWFWHNSASGHKNFAFSTENFDAFFEDQIVPNQKYYYLFRSMSYHNTPSNPTVIYEVELLEDSDETKLSIHEFKFEEKNYNTHIKMAKRIMKIYPNFEQLIFNESDNAIGILPNKLFLGPDAFKTFKFRITSKHTGKKMDINVTFRLADET